MSRYRRCEVSPGKKQRAVQVALASLFFYRVTHMEDVPRVTLGS